MLLTADPPLLIFLAVNYALALLMWLCVGRMLLAPFVARNPSNYIWRSFRYLTEWAVIAVSVVTPRYVARPFLVPIAAFWIYYLRLGLFVAARLSGFLPPPPV